jgi:PiT family inorganic phosphate transporter
MLTLVIGIILIALVFDFLNGMNDAANSIATVVSTRVLTPKQAVAWAAFWNFVAFALLGTEVAKTISGKVLAAGVESEMLVLATLVGAVLWTHLCTAAGLPISVSHALIGGLVGSGVAKAGFAALKADGILKIVLFIFLAPVIGLVAGAILMLLVYWVFRNRTPARVDYFFRSGQLLSSALFSLGHGGNDAQKTMAIITILLMAAYPTYQDSNQPQIWVVLAAHSAIALGTLMGGWRVIRTMGSKLTKLRPEQGFCAEMAGAGVLWGATFTGIPVSTTHSITGSILGVGSVKRWKAVRWGVVTRILWAWVLTIPAAAVVSGLVYGGLDLVGLTRVSLR